MHIKKQTFDSFNLQRVTGGDFLREKPLFTDNGKRLILSSKEECHIYSTETGEHVKHLFTCDSAIINLQINPHNDEQIICFTELGQCITYDLKTNSNENVQSLTLSPKKLHRLKIIKFNSVDLPKEIKNGLPSADWDNEVKSAKFLHGYVDSNKIYASWYANSEYYSHLSIFSTKTGKQITVTNQLRAALQKTSENFIVSNNILVGKGTDFILVFDLSTKNKFRHFIGLNTTITCLAMGKDEYGFATGDTQGRVIVWRNAFQNYPLKNVLHWHTLPVRALAFSDQGSHIFSGGDENVLVKWYLGSQNKTYLPRLTSNIHQISVARGSALMAISTTDSRILITNLNLSSISTIQHFSNWSALSLIEDSSICVQDPRTDALVLNGRTGHVQFLSSTERGRFLYTLDITKQNFRTSERDCALENADVRFVRFTRCGKWLISGETGPRDSRLKFWEFKENEQQYCLNTNVEMPHGMDIICLEVSSDETAVTTGPDNEFRLWSIVETQHVNVLRLHWAQIGNSGYRHLPVSVADFSRDGSAVGVAFGPTLTVWDTDECALKCNLTAPLKRLPIKVIQFGNMHLSHMVVTGTDAEVTSWNLVTLCIQWVVPLNLSTIIRDFGSSYMVAFSKNSGLFLFQPSSPTPDIRMESVCASEVVSGVFIPKNQSSELYFFTRDRNLYHFGDSSSNSVFNLEATTERTPFSAIQAENISKDVKKGKEMQQVLASSEMSAMKLLQGGAHMQPPMIFLCPELLKSMLLTVPKTNQNNPIEKDVILMESKSDTQRKVTVDESALRKTFEQLFISPKDKINSC